jgi:hypothetical protein
MKIRKSIPIILILSAFIYANYGRCLYLKDIDRKEKGELGRIIPPPAAIELKLIRSFPTTEQEEAGQYLPQPDSLARDRLGNYYIADQKASVIYKYDSSGKYVGQFGRPGQGPGDLSLPRHIEIFDDIIHVNDVGNMRTQYFDLKGQFIKTTRMFKSFVDLAFLQDGQIVGAPLSVEWTGDKALVEILASDGKIVRAFGDPFEFKYDRSAMNTRKIIVNKKNEIILVFDFLPILQRYSMQGQLLQEKRLETEFSFQKERINRRMNSYLPDQKAAKVIIFHAVGILDDTIYIVDHVPPRIWIWAVDENLRIIRTYWASTGDYLFARDFLPTVENGQINFIILGSLSPYEAKIHIFAPK